MDEPESAPDHKTLNALNEQIAAEQTRIADLEHRTRVIDVELASWKALPPLPRTPSGASISVRFFAFIAGALVTGAIGNVIAALVKQ